MINVFILYQIITIIMVYHLLFNNFFKKTGLLSGATVYVLALSVGGSPVDTDATVVCGQEVIEEGKQLLL